MHRLLPFYINIEDGFSGGGLFKVWVVFVVGNALTLAAYVAAVALVVKAAVA